MPTPGSRFVVNPPVVEELKGTAAMAAMLRSAPTRWPR